MKYPIINISIKSWEKYKKENFYIYKRTRDFNFKNKKVMLSFIDNLFVDSNGDIFKLINYKKIPIYKRLKKLIFLADKYDLNFENTNQKMPIAEFRKFLYENVKNMHYEYANMVGEDQTLYYEEIEDRNYWLNLIRTSNSYQDMLCGYFNEFVDKN